MMWPSGKASVCKTDIAGSSPVIISHSQKYLTVHITYAIINIEQKAQLPIIYAAKHTPQIQHITKKVCRKTLEEYIFFSGSFCMQKKDQPKPVSLNVYSDLRYSIMSPTIQAPSLYSSESWSRLILANQSSSLSANSPASCSSSISGAGLYMLLPE